MTVVQGISTGGIMHREDHCCGNWETTVFKEV